MTRLHTQIRIANEAWEALPVEVCRELGAEVLEQNRARIEGEANV